MPLVPLEGSLPADLGAVVGADPCGGPAVVRVVLRSDAPRLCFEAPPLDGEVVGGDFLPGLPSEPRL